MSRNTTVRARQALRLRAQALIDRVAGQPLAAAVESWQLARSAHRLALEAGDRLLEAEALRQMYRSHGLSLHPAQSLQAMREAEQIFRANRLPSKAAECRIGVAFALYELGQERDAIQSVQCALQEDALLAEDRVLGHVLTALCHGHIGELDIGLHGLNHHALPLALACRNASLLARVKCASALMYLQVMIYRRYPELWRGLSDAVVTVAEPEPPPSLALSLLDEAQAALPDGATWAYIDMPRHVLLGLSGGPAMHDQACHALAAIADRFEAADPPMATRALMCLATVLLRIPAKAKAALEILSRAIQLAESLGLLSTLRDILLLQSRGHELVGDAALALAAYRRHADLRFKSLITRPFEAMLPLWKDAASSAETASAVPLPARGAAHVTRALSFIDDRFCDDISVDDVARHGEVGRRTLEIAFKEATSRTVAEYIRQRRLDRAAGDLLNTRKAIQDVALSIGYRSPAAFSREFNARYGVTPSAWRRARSMRDLAAA